LGDVSGGGSDGAVTCAAVPYCSDVLPPLTGSVYVDVITLT